MFLPRFENGDECEGYAIGEMRSARACWLPSDANCLLAATASSLLMPTYGHNESINGSKSNLTCV